ncbi:MAG: GTP-binding protein, partial [Clostridia bacterium]|nr:GTP-binding protein [Clostridia bacterium]
MIRNDLRNIAIIAHVDHGKTTLVDEMLKQGGIFRANQQVADRVMDNGDLEKERGITILAKNTAAYYHDVKINLIDTPGHADFSGEVERVLKMVNGVLLLVDAVEGPMPQTRFVLQKALELNHKIIICVNKVDRADAEPARVVDEVLSLLIDLNATEEQFESPIVYCSGRQGTASMTVEQKADLSDLFETIVNYIDPPSGDENGKTQVLVSSIDYNDYVGRIGIGRVERGVVRPGAEVAICDYHGNVVPYKSKLVTLMQIDGLRRVPVESATVGDIVCFSGI